MSEETRRKFLRGLVADELANAGKRLREAADHLDNSQMVAVLIADAQADVAVAKRATEATSTVSGAVLLDKPFAKKVLAASEVLVKLATEVRGLPVTVKESRLVKRGKAESRLSRDYKKGRS